jgi:hypothetical protein
VEEGKDAGLHLGRVKVELGPGKEELFAILPDSSLRFFTLFVKIK